MLCSSPISARTSWNTGRRLPGAAGTGKPGAGHYHVEPGQEAHVCREGSRGFADKAAQAAENSFDLALLLYLQLSPAVGEVDNDQRFYEQCRPAGGDVVDDTPDLTSEIGF